MKIFQINVCYPYGSTGKIVKDLHENLINDGFDSKVIYAYMHKYDDERLIKLSSNYVFKLQSLQSRITGYAYAGAFFSTHKLIKILRKEKPDIVHLQCINGFMVNIYKLLEYLKKENIKTILTLHAEFMYTAGCGYSYDCNKWKTGCYECGEINKNRPKSYFFDRSSNEWNRMYKTLIDFDDLIVCCVSDWVKSRVCQSPFFKKKKIYTVNNGVNINIFNNNYLSSEKENVLRKNKIENSKYILFVTPDFYSPIKGGNYLIEIAKKMPEKEFVVVGLNDEKKLLPQNVLAIPHTDNQKELAILYNEASVTLLLSKRETFSMVTAESLCCGTQVIGFKAGAPEMIALKEYSNFAEYGDIDKIIDYINTIKEYNKKEVSKIACQKYDKSNMYHEYLNIYTSTRGES